MARISTYAIESPAEAGDRLLGSNPSNDTKNFTVGSIIDLIGINGTKDTIAMFGSGTSLKDSIITQSSNGTSISIGSDDSQEVTTEATLNIQGPVKDSSGTLGGNEQVLVSNASGNLSWAKHFKGEVTSVGITETGDALTITGSPVTTAGDINIAGAGTANQVILGNLALGSIGADVGNVVSDPTAAVMLNSIPLWTGRNPATLSSDSPITTVGGSVGIGTSGINPQDKLHVQGTVRAVVPGSSGIAFNAINGFGVSSAFRFDNNHAVLALKNNSSVVATKISSDGFSWFNGGGVGFGTTTPASPVEMVIPDTSSTSRGGLLLSEAGDSSTLDSVRVEYKSNKNVGGNPGLIFTPRSQPPSGVVWETFFRFKTNGGEATGNKANLTVDGKVGIGTTSDNFDSRLTVAKGDIEVTEYQKGLILRSTNGSRYRLTVEDDGTLTTRAII